MSKPLFIALAALAALAGAGDAFAQQRAPGGRDLEIETTRPRPRPVAQRPPRDAFAVSIMSLSGRAVRVGRPVRLRLVSTVDAFGSLYVINASGRVQLWFENVLMKAGRPIDFPRRGQTMRAVGPAGADQIIFIATKQPQEGFAGSNSTIDPLTLNFPPADLSAEVERRLSSLERKDWARAEIKVRVLD